MIQSRQAECVSAGSDLGGIEADSPEPELELRGTALPGYTRVGVLIGLNTGISFAVSAFGAQQRPVCLSNSGGCCLTLT